MHLFHLLRGQRLHHVELILESKSKKVMQAASVSPKKISCSIIHLRVVELGPGLSWRVHGLGGLVGQRLEIGGRVDAEPLTQIPEHQGAVLLHLEVAGQVLLVEGVVVHLANRRHWAERRSYATVSLSPDSP